MPGYLDILDSLPITDLAKTLGTDEDTTRQAAATALPALIGGLQANTSDPAGAQSLVSALDNHPASLVEGGINLGDVNTADGEKIVHNVFGSESDQVISRLGGTSSAGSAIFRQLLPLLAPLVLSWLTKQVQGRSSGTSSTDTSSSTGGGLGNLLGGIFGNREDTAGSTAQDPATSRGTTAGTTRTGTTGTGTTGTGTAGTVPPAGVNINDILGDMLGGAATSQRTSRSDGSRTDSSAPAGGGIDDLLGGILGGLLGGGKR